MFQRNRIAFAAAGLAAALLLMVPAPSRAAVLWEDRLPGIGALEQIWGWISRLWPAGEPSGTTTVVWEQDGGAVVPDGQPHNSTTPPSSSQGDSGQ